jgi:hypothetical protein
VIYEESASREDTPGSAWEAPGSVLPTGVQPPDPAGRVLGLPCGSPIARVPLPISCDVLPAREGIGCIFIN